MFEGQTLNEELIVGQKLSPGAVAESRWTDQQRALALLLVDLEDFASDKGFAKPYFVGNDNAAGIADQP